MHQLPRAMRNHAKGRRIPQGRRLRVKAWPRSTRLTVGNHKYHRGQGRRAQGPSGRDQQTKIHEWCQFHRDFSRLQSAQYQDRNLRQRREHILQNETNTNQRCNDTNRDPTKRSNQRRRNVKQHQQLSRRRLIQPSNRSPIRIQQHNPINQKPLKQHRKLI